MFAYEWLNKLGIWFLVGAVVMTALTGLWNWVMPELGVPRLNVLQFTALFVIVQSLTIDLVGFKKPNQEKPEIK